MDCTNQAPLSLEFLKQEYWSGLPLPPPGDLPNPEIEPRSSTLQAASLPSELQGFPCGSDSKESACNVGDLGSISGLGRSPGEGHGNPFQYSYLENPMDRGTWWARVHRVPKEADMTEVT